MAGCRTPSISLPRYARIGVATAYGRPYYGFTKLLQDIGIGYDSILPDQIETYTGSLVLTTHREAPQNPAVAMLYEDMLDAHPTVLRGMILQKLDRGMGDGRLILGIDPGSRLGLSVYYLNQEIESSLHSSVDGLVSRIITILAGLRARRKIVKIGNGNMALAKEIGDRLNLKFCSSFELEFVDERRTSPKIKNYNQRGKRDRLSARYITQREGSGRLVLPLSLTG